MSAKKTKNSPSSGKPTREKAPQGKGSEKQSEVEAEVALENSPEAPSDAVPVELHDKVKPEEETPADTGDITSKPPSPPPDRARVVDLAGRMISAQIVAVSNYETTMATVRHLQRVLVDVTDALGHSDSGDLDSRQVFNRIAEALRRMPSPENWLARRGFLDPLGNNDLDDMFMSALHRAERLLSAPESDAQMVFAEQIFEPKEQLSENKVFERFRDYGWPDLSSRPTVTGLMASVDSWFAACFEEGRMSAPIRQAEVHQRKRQKEASILMRAMRLCDELGNDKDHSYKSHYREAADAIGAQLRARDIKSLGQISNRVYHYEHQKLMVMMFGKSAPIARIKSSPSESKQDKKRSPAREYRPWAVFRYLRRYGVEEVDELGLELNRKLCTPRNLLDPAFTPDIHGIIPEEFEFGPLGQEVDDYFAEQDAEAERAEDYLAEQERQDRSAEDELPDPAPADDDLLL